MGMGENGCIFYMMGYQNCTKREACILQFTVLCFRLGFVVIYALLCKILDWKTALCKYFDIFYFWLSLVWNNGPPYSKVWNLCWMAFDVCLSLLPWGRDQPFLGITGVLFFQTDMKPVRRIIADSKLKKFQVKVL